MPRRGFSLAEMIVSLGLFAVMALGMLGLFVASRTVGEEGAGTAQAVSVAVGQLNLCKTLPYATLAAYLPEGNVPAGSVTLQGVLYTSSLRVTLVNPTAAATAPDYGLLDVRLQTDWLEKQALAMDKQAAAAEVTRSLFVHSVVGTNDAY